LPDVKKFVARRGWLLLLLPLGAILAFMASTWACDDTPGKLIVSCFRLDDPLTDWEVQKKKGEPDFKLEKQEGFVALRLKSDNSSFGYAKEMDFDLKEYPYLNWRWRVTVLPTGGDFRSKKTDDQAAQIYVAFPRGWTRLSTESVGYYWDNLPPKGATGESPSWSKLQVMILRDRKDALDTWYMEKRNVYEDYKRLFGAEPPRVGGVGIYINSQHTESKAEASWAEIFFSKE